MAETNGNGSAPVAGPGPGQPALNALVQFTKDFSFENPNAPRSLGPQDKAPNIFRLQNIPEEQKHPVVMIECPRLLFPFARQIIAEAVRGGGFPPLYIDPIDFAALYQARMAEIAKQGGPAAQA